MVNPWLGASWNLAPHVCQGSGKARSRPQARALGSCQSSQGPLPGLGLRGHDNGQSAHGLEGTGALSGHCTLGDVSQVFRGTTLQLFAWSALLAARRIKRSQASTRYKRSPTMNLLKTVPRSSERPPRHIWQKDTQDCRPTRRSSAGETELCAPSCRPSALAANSSAWPCAIPLRATRLAQHHPNQAAARNSSTCNQRLGVDRSVPDHNTT